MTETHPIQRLALIAIGALGVLVAFSSLPGIWVGSMGREAWGVGPQFLVAAFEALTLAAGITAGVLGFGRRLNGLGLGVLCVAGTVFVGAVLGAKMLQSSSDQVPSLRTFVMARLAMAAALVGLTGVVKLGTRGDCWRGALFGSALLLPLGAIAGLIIRKKAHLVTEPISQLGEVAQMVVWLALAVVLGVLTIAGGHLVIRAFEKTREPPAGEPKAGTPKAE